MDRLAELIGQWEKERPDLELRAMLTVARVLASARRLEAGIAETAARHGLSIPEGDIVFTLRRSGPPYRLTPSRLVSALLVPSGTLTNRLDRLERKGLIERVPNPGDRRSVEIALTDKGHELSDALVTEHVANEARMLAPLSEREIDTLNRILAKLSRE